MTQKEFDAKMFDINQNQQKAAMPIKMHINGLNTKKLELRAKISELYHQLDLLAAERHREETKLKALNADFHLQKHQLNIQWKFENGEAPADAGE